MTLLPGSTGLQSLHAIRIAAGAAFVALALTVALCLILIRTLHGRTFRSGWVWCVSPAIGFTLFLLVWLLVDLLWQSAAGLART